MMIETTGILVHYTWMFSIPYLAGYSVAGMLGFMLVAQMISGVLLSFVFVQVPPNPLPLHRPRRR
jgi:hypothetical protein